MKNVIHTEPTIVEAEAVFKAAFRKLDVQLPTVLERNGVNVSRVREIPAASWLALAEAYRVIFVVSAVLLFMPFFRFLVRRRTSCVEEVKLFCCLHKRSRGEGRGEPSPLTTKRMDSEILVGGLVNARAPKKKITVWWRRWPQVDDAQQKTPHARSTSHCLA